MNLFDEVLKHFFGIRKIGDDAILHGSHGCDVRRRSSEHLLCLCTDSNNDFAAATRFVLDGNDGGFVEYDSARLDVNQGIGGAKIDRQVIGKMTAEVFQHGVRSCSEVCGKDVAERN